MELCSSFRILFEGFIPVFSPACFPLWQTLMTGWILSHRHRYISDLIVSSDATRSGDWSAFYRFFNRYRWSLDAVFQQVTRLVISTLIPRDAVIILAIDNIDLISRATIKAALYEPAPKPTGCRGRRRKKGERLPSIDEWADDPGTAWTTLAIDQYGLHTTLRWKRREALFYGVGKDHLMSIIVVEDIEGKRGREVFFCTNVNWSLQYILHTYARRWSIEVTFENLKQLLGFSDAANWKEPAVRRTAPMAGVLYSLIVVWFHQEGHRSVEFPHRPWYPQKRWPSFGDMLTTLRRLTFEEKMTQCKGEPGNEKFLIRQLTYFLTLAG